MIKSKFIKLAAVAFLFSTTIIAQENSKDIVYIKSARFATPLVEAWISEYNIDNPETQLELVDQQSTNEHISINLISESFEQENELAGRSVSYAGRYALLPISNANNPFLAEIGRKGLQEKKLENLFFEKDIYDSTSGTTKKDKYNATIYSGNNEYSFASSFASHFGYSPISIKGRKISGDDLFLIQAIQKDNTGITFNNLSYIFNIDTRKLKDDLSIIPLDLKKEQREVIENADIDAILQLLEKDKISLIPVEGIGFAYDDNSLAAKMFLKWVLSQGQEYNHKYGFLKAEEDVITAQVQTIENSLLTASH